jgi:hypothetical protein
MFRSPLNLAPEIDWLASCFNSVPVMRCQIILRGCKNISLILEKLKDYADSCVQVGRSLE